MKAPERLALMNALVGGESFLPAPPVVNCAECYYKKCLPADGGHCYMFRNAPEDGRCAQFKEPDHE